MSNIINKLTKIPAMGTRHIRFILLGILVLLALIAKGQKFYLTTYTKANGLPSNRVNQVMEDSLGFLWIATDAGLVCYDGKDFSTFRKSLRSMYVRSLYNTTKYDYVVATDAGLSSFKSFPDTAIIETLVAANVQDSDSTLLYPNKVFEDQYESMWISQPNGTIVRVGENFMKFYPLGDEFSTGASTSHFTFLKDSLNVLWAISQTGHLFYYERDEDKFVLAQKLKRINDGKILNGVLWLAGKGVYKIPIVDEFKLGEIQYFSTGNLEINAFEIDEEQNLYLGTKLYGLYRARETGKKLTISKVFSNNDPHRIDELPFQQINDIYLNKRGDIWLSTREGLGLLQKRFFETIYNAPSDNCVKVNKGVQDKIFVSIGDLYEINNLNNEFHARKWQSASNGIVISIAGAKEKLWTGTTAGELNRYNAKGKIDYSIDLSDRGSGVFHVAGDYEGHLWFCQAPLDRPLVGVAKITADLKIRYYDALDGIETRALVVKTNKKGVVYVGGIGPKTYLYRYDKKKDKFINLSLTLPFAYKQNFEVHDIAIDDKGLVWLATTDGLLCYNLERIQRIHLDERLKDAEIRGVETMPDGSVWIATDTYGVLRYKDGKYTFFDESSGLPSKITTYRNLIKDAQNRLWVGTAEGAAYSSAVVPVPEFSEKPMFVSADINGTKVDPKADNLLTVSGNAKLHFKFISISFPGDALVYQHRIMGQQDTMWSLPSKNTSLLLSKLAYGKYEVQVRAKKSLESEWSKPLIVRLNVKQLWYKTWWAWLLYICAGLIFFWFFLRTSVLQLIKKIRSLEQALARTGAKIKEKETLLEQKDEAIEKQALYLEKAKGAIKIQNKEIKKRTAVLKILQSITDSVSQISEKKEIIKILAKAIENTPSIEYIALGVYRKDRQEIVYSGYSKLEQSYIRQTQSVVHKTLDAIPFKNNQKLSVKNLEVEYPLFYKKSIHHFLSHVYIPFSLENKQKAMLVIKSTPKNAFYEQDEMMLSLIANYLQLFFSKNQFIVKNDA